MKRLLLAFVLLLGVAVVADAQSVQIQSILVEDNVTKGSESGVRLHIKVSVHGFKGRSMKAIAYLHSPKGVAVNDTNGKCRTTDGKVCFSKKFQPSYDRSVFNDLQIFMPYNEMHLQRGSHVCYCRVSILADGHRITRSDYVEFVGKGSNAPSHHVQHSHHMQHSHHVPSAGTFPNENQFVYYTNNSGGLASVRIYYSNDVKKRCAYLYFKPNSQSRGEIRYFTKQYFDSSGRYWAFKEYMQWLTHRQGKSSTLYIAEDWSYVKIENTRFDIPISKERFDQLVPKVSGGGGGGHNGGYNSGGNGGGGYQNGPSHIDKPCGYCGGGGGCRSCNGRGYKYNHYSGHDERCSSCNGSGRCFNCRGTGKQATF
jgi:hypothetical protein